VIQLVEQAPLGGFEAVPLLLIARDREIGNRGIETAAVA